MLFSSNIFFFWICCLISPSHWVMAQLFKAWLHTLARESLHFLCSFSPSWTLSPQAHFLYFLRGGWESYSLYSTVFRTLSSQKTLREPKYSWTYFGHWGATSLKNLLLSYSIYFLLFWTPLQTIQGYWEEWPWAHVYLTSWDLRT